MPAHGRETSLELDSRRSLNWTRDGHSATELPDGWLASETPPSLSAFIAHETLAPRRGV